MLLITIQGATRQVSLDPKDITAMVPGLVNNENVTPDTHTMFVFKNGRDTYVDASLTDVIAQIRELAPHVDILMTAKRTSDAKEE